MSKQLVHSCNNNADDEILPVGSAKTLQRAMTVTKLSEMLDCIKDMKSYASTIEKDLPEYLETNPIYRNNDTNSVELEKTDDFIQLANQRFNNNRYVLLNDLIEQKKKTNQSQLKTPIINKHKNSLVDQQVEYMKRIIAAQPSALEAIYLEALLNPDQWKHNHHLLKTSPMDNLTSSERKRLNEILK